MATEKKGRNKLVMELATSFLRAVMHREDWHEFAQLRTRKMQAAPNMPAFMNFRVIRTHAPGRGLDPDVCRAVFIELTLGGSDRLKMQVVSGRLLAVKECDWAICPDCNDGITEDGDACRQCDGTGKMKIEPPRIPVKGSDTFEHDMENGVWGVCPTSFEFISGTQKLVE